MSLCHRREVEEILMSSGDMERVHTTERGTGTETGTSNRCLFFLPLRTTRQEINSKAGGPSIHRLHPGSFLIEKQRFRAACSLSSFGRVHGQDIHYGCGS